MNSDNRINIDFQRISDEQLKSTKNFESQIKGCAKETEKLLKIHVKSVTAVSEDTKRITKKRGCENKRMATTENSSLSDQEPTSKKNDKDCATTINTLLKISPPQNKEFAKETNELLIKETKVLTSIDTKKMYKKKGKVSVKNNLISDLEQSSKNSDEVSITSSETSSIDSLRNLTSQSKKFPENSDDSLIKEQSPKSNGMDSFSLEISSIDFSKNSLSQSKQFSKNSEEPVIKDTPTVTTLNIKSMKICRRKSGQNKVKVSAKKSLIVDSEEASKNNEMDNITPSKTSSFDSSKNSPSQSKELAKATVGLLFNNITIETQTQILNSKRIYRKKGSGNKSKVAAKLILISNSEPASKNSDKDNISTSTDSSNNSPS
ncbi:hypothetical protein HNY73_011223 [Argiope bruennichi]|uniref:Uncharacterized protein n=1 Tax=Argiope bruennichi TaxID=94029 RepID=A0A8T0F8I0_ARGBR|nr:hypothetical protein HNY73_011223 [Argiope bruennichi]